MHPRKKNAFYLSTVALKVGHFKSLYNLAEFFFSNWHIFKKIHYFQDFFFQIFMFYKSSYGHVRSHAKFGHDRLSRFIAYKRTYKQAPKESI